MNSVAVVAAIICVSALVCSFVSIAVPQGSTKKVMNIVLGVFILCTMIIPIKNVVENFSLEISVADSAEDLTASADEAYNNAVISETKSILESNLKSVLCQKNINIEDAEINLSVDENGGIYIDSICIYILKKDENLTSEIIAITKGKYEIVPEVVTR